MEQAHPMVIEGTLDQHEAFQQSFVWKDVQRELLYWLEDARNHLEIEKESSQISHLQGVCEAIRHVVELPQLIIYQLRQPPRTMEIDHE